MTNFATPKLTSKLWNTHHEPEHVEEAVDQSLRDLQTDYLDLYLVRIFSQARIIMNLYS